IPGSPNDARCPPTAGGRVAIFHVIVLGSRDAEAERAVCAAPPGATVTRSRADTNAAIGAGDWRVLMIPGAPVRRRSPAHHLSFLGARPPKRTRSRAPSHRSPVDLAGEQVRMGGDPVEDQH